jgi:integrase
MKMPTYANVIPLSQTSFSGKLPRKPRNQAVRSREYLTEVEVGKLMKAARNTGRHGHRDATLILVAYRHALRVAELVALRWEQINLSQGLLHVVRRKHGVDGSHPLRGPEIRALRQLQRDYPETPYVFVTERKGPLTASTVRKLVARAGRLRLMSRTSGKSSSPAAAANLEIRIELQWIEPVI